MVGYSIMHTFYKPEPAIISYQKGKLLAHGNTYRIKSLLKSFGFFWNPQFKYWEKSCAMNTAMSIMDQMGEHIHLDRFGVMKWMS